jgi:hypothetical protein
LLIGFADGSMEQKGKRRRRQPGSTLIREEKAVGNSETWPAAASDAVGK